MRPIQRLISAGFATAAIASASVPALAWTVWPDVDFQWYADVGQPVGPTAEVVPAPRAGYIWSPGHWERRGLRGAWIGAHWVKDDYDPQLATYGTGERIASGATVPRDGEGRDIFTPDAHPLEGAH